MAANPKRPRATALQEPQASSIPAPRPSRSAKHQARRRGPSTRTLPQAPPRPERAPGNSPSPHRTRRPSQQTRTRRLRRAPRGSLTRHRQRRSPPPALPPCGAGTRAAARDWARTKSRTFSKWGSRSGRCETGSHSMSGPAFSRTSAQISESSKRRRNSWAASSSGLRSHDLWMSSSARP